MADNESFFNILSQPKDFGLMICELSTDLEFVDSSFAGNFCDIYYEIGNIGREKKINNKNSYHKSSPKYYN